MVDDDAWLCPEEVTMECRFAQPDEAIIFALPPETQTCADVDLEVDPGPYPPGTHDIVIRDEAAGGISVCVAELHVQDTQPPELETRRVELWPPNHDMVTVTPEDCVAVEEVCDPDVDLFFTSVSSNEPRDATGDGATAEDVIVDDCDSVQLRAERRGNGSGRIYRLGVTAVDDSGHVTMDTCEVVVPHDQGKPFDALGAEPAYTLAVPDCDGDAGAGGASGAGGAAGEGGAADDGS
jgi:hypothetical protein